MIYVGISEVENRLGEYVRRVRDGETILLTEGGKIVAKLTKHGHIDEQMDEDVASLEADGLLSRNGGENHPALYDGLKPLLQKNEIFKLLDAERGDH